MTPWAPYVVPYDRPFRIGWDENGHFAVHLLDTPGFPRIMAAAHHQDNVVLFSEDGGQNIVQQTPFRLSLSPCGQEAPNLWFHPLALPHLHLTRQLPIEVIHMLIRACEHSPPTYHLGNLSVTVRQECSVLDMLQASSVMLTICTSVGVEVF